MIPDSAFADISATLIKSQKKTKKLAIYVLLDHDFKKFGVKKSGIEVIQGNKVDLAEMNMKETGSIKGNVKLKGRDDQTGIDVYISGTTFTAKTDESGEFIILF